MERYLVRDEIWWVGAIDWNVRDFHGYETPRGTTYNAYLIIDEKVALVDGCREGFGPEMLQRVRGCCSARKVDYLVINHVEPDHSGAIPWLVEQLVPERIFCSKTGQGSPGPVLRIGCGRRLGPADRRDGGRAFARSQYPPVHRSSHAALAGQHVHLRSRVEDAPSQRRFRAASGHLEALRRRGRHEHRHGRSQQVLRQHPHALRRPDTEDARQDR